jgi:uncharacterized protein (DUF952 family)
MILHVCSTEEWDHHKNNLYYQPAAFAKEGFIHCCYENQLAGVMQRYFKGRLSLLLLFLDESKIIAEIRFEKGPAQQIFPHVHGVINKDAIVKIERL